MIEILNWTAVISGGILVLLFLISILSGLDFDLDIGSSDVDSDSGGIGLIKGGLTFLSIGSWVVKIALLTNVNPKIAILVGVLSGILAFYILSYIFNYLLSLDSDVNWIMEDAVGKKGEVYLKIPENGLSGLILINIKGANRELKAKSISDEEIETGAEIIVDYVDDEFAYVVRK